MNCKHCTELLQEYLDESLPSELSEKICSHIENCACCRTQFKTYSLTIKLSRDSHVPRQVTHEMQARLRSKLLEHLNSR